MTDKQIIVDGVDVSGCEFLISNNDKRLCRCIKVDLFGGIEFVENAKNANCKDNPNCYYKNWQRKEQECEELKKVNEEKNELFAKLGCPTIASARMKAFTLQEQLDQLKAELTRANCQIADDEILQCDMREAIEELKAENEELKGIRDRNFLAALEEQKRADKYFKTLTEIKEIAEKIDDECEYSCFASCAKKAKEQILQKISEVEECR